MFLRELIVDCNDEQRIKMFLFLTTNDKLFFLTQTYLKYFNLFIIILHYGRNKVPIEGENHPLYVSTE